MPTSSASKPTGDASKAPKAPKPTGGASKAPKATESAESKPTGGASKAPDMPSGPLECELNLQPLVKKLKRLTALYNSDPNPSIKSLIAKTLQELLEKHPFVHTTETTANSVDHSFKVVGFTINMRSFRDWLKTPEGKPYKGIQGTGVDDTVYLISELLRVYLPRGCHVITATNSVTGVETVFRFVGINKFSGLQPGDEDEESASSAAAFFVNGQTMANVTEIYVTEKINGENAKLSMIKIDGVLYLIAGSKTTCSIWPADEDFFESYPLKEGENPDGEYPSTTICKLYSEWFRGLTPEQRLRFCDEFEKHNSNLTIVAELNRERAPHIVKNKSTYLTLFTMLGSNGPSIDPKEVFSFFKSIGVTDSDTESVRHVRMRERQISSPTELTELVDKIRQDENSEGAVLYLFGKNGLVGLAKVKTNWYVLRRSLRELCRNNLFAPLTRGDCKGVPNLPSRRNKPTEKTWQKTTFDVVVKTAINKARGKCGDFGVNFIKYLVAELAKMLSTELGDQNLSDYIAEQLSIQFPVETESVIGEMTPLMTPLMTALKTLNERFNNAFPQLVEMFEASKMSS